MLLKELSIGKHGAKVGRNEAIQQASSPARRRYGQKAIALEPSVAGLLVLNPLGRSIRRKVIQLCLTAGTVPTLLMIGPLLWPGVGTARGIKRWSRQPPGCWHQAFGKSVFRRVIQLRLTAKGGTDTADDRAAAMARRRYGQRDKALEPSAAGLLAPSHCYERFQGGNPTVPDRWGRRRHCYTVYKKRTPTLPGSFLVNYSLSITGSLIL